MSFVATSGGALCASYNASMYHQNISGVIYQAAILHGWEKSPDFLTTRLKTNVYPTLTVSRQQRETVFDG